MLEPRAHGGVLVTKAPMAVLELKGRCGRSVGDVCSWGWILPNSCCEPCLYPEACRVPLVPDTAAWYSCPRLMLAVLQGLLYLLS